MGKGFISLRLITRFTLNAFKKFLVALTERYLIIKTMTPLILQKMFSILRP